LVALREIGFNRASMGVQDFNPQSAGGDSPHPAARNDAAGDGLDARTRLRLDQSRFDLRPAVSDAATFNETLDTVLEMKPDRLAVFSYAHVPWIKPAQKILEEKILPTPESKLEVLKLVIEKLTADDQYVYIGMDHFAKPTTNSPLRSATSNLQRNFQGYSTRAGSDIYAFGMSAVSQTPDVYWQNEKELPKYQAAVDAGQRAAAQSLHRERRG
jgi:oxygen-independent coproporphyrinogen-3 oxidase